MAFGTAQSGRLGEAWAALVALVADDGSARDGHVARLTAPGAVSRDLADAVHCLCLLHGRHPGIVEVASSRATDPAIVAWLAEAAAAIASERAVLVRLVAAVGPLPSTPGQAESEAAIAGQRHALDMLAASDRAGCPIGATVALLLDWPALRDVLTAAANRIGFDMPESALPDRSVSAAAIAQFSGTIGFERAMLFGAQQILAQHRALWQLLESRATARGAG